MKRDKTGKMGGRLTSQYKYSANFLGDDIIVNISSHRCNTPFSQQRNINIKSE